MSKDTVKFSKMELNAKGELVEAEVREIKSADIKACPHTIFVAEHYRDDGTCRCNDPDAKEMAEWGYEWRDNQWRSPRHEDDDN